MKSLNLFERAFFLKKVRIFSELNLDALLAIAEQLHYDEYDPNERIFAIDQMANRMYFIVGGNVQLFDHHMRLIATLERGDFFGDEALFNEQPRSYCSVSLGETHLLTISRSHLLAVISEFPSVAVSFLQAYSQNALCRLNRRLS